MGYPETIANVGCVGCHASMFCMTGNYTRHITACARCSKYKVILLRKDKEPMSYTYAKGLRVDLLHDIVELDLREVLCHPEEARHLCFFCQICSSS